MLIGTREVNMDTLRLLLWSGEGSSQQEADPVPVHFLEPKTFHNPHMTHVPNREEPGREG